MRLACLVIAALLLAAPAAAKDRCYADNVGYHVYFVKWKEPKKLGQAVALNGFMHATGNHYPVFGSAVKGYNGDILVGMVVQLLLTGVNWNVSMSIDPETGIGTGGYDMDGDGSGDEARTWTPINCKDADGV